MGQCVLASLAGMGSRRLNWEFGGANSGVIQDLT